MSKAYALRQAIKASIVAADIGLAADDIIIKRQGDIFTQIDENISVASNGVMLTIGSGKRVNMTPELDTPRWKTTLSLKLWVAPIYHDANMPEEDISEALENHLSCLVLDTTAPRPIQELEKIKVIDSDDVPDTELLVRELTITAIQQN